MRRGRPLLAWLGMFWLLRRLMRHGPWGRRYGYGGYRGYGGYGGFRRHGGFHSL